MGAPISIQKRINVLSKTKRRCSVCGCKENLTCDHFIPQWTRCVNNEFEILIPMCEKCNSEKDMNFLELSKLKYLPTVYIEMLMRFYDEQSNYLKVYVRKFGSYRTNGKLDVERALLVLKSYDTYIMEHAEDLRWEVLEDYND